MANLNTILICDDDPLFQLSIKKVLGMEFQCLSAANGDEALTLIKNKSIQILLLDIHMRTPNEGLSYIGRFLQADSEISIVISSQYRDFETVREAMRLGAVDYIPKDCEIGEITHAIQRVLERRQLIRLHEQQTFEVKHQQGQFPLIGIGSWSENIRKIIEKVKNARANVVLTGETGTGKEVIARQLRRTLPNGSLEPFLAIDSSTIQSSMAESLLFGHEKGAFTGADKTTKGLFEEADGGTVYFDEIANMPLEIQSKLLRVLQEKEISRLGSSKLIKLDFRVICASNKDLPGLIEAGKFKEDLYQRLNVIPIHLAPLRERREDIPELLHHFANRCPSEKGFLEFSPAAMEILKGYDWPGNVRELSNLVAYLATMTDSAMIAPSDLPPRFQSAPAGATLSREGAKNFYSAVREFEKTYLNEKFREFSGNVSLMARNLEMDRSHLYTKLKELKILVPKSEAKKSAANQNH